MPANIFRYIAGIVIIAVIGLIVWYFSNIVVYIIISAILSLIGQPVVRILHKIKIGRFKMPRALNAGLTLLLIWIK